MSTMFIDAWQEETGPLVDAVIPALKGKFWDDLSPRFFVTFWILSMYDLEVPKASYNRETDKLKQQSQDLEDNSLQQNKKKKEIERTRLLMEKLLEEQLKQDQHVSRIRMRLDVEKDQWFQSSKLSIKSESLISDVFLLLCTIRSGKDGDDDPVPAVLSLSPMHFHRI